MKKPLLAMVLVFAMAIPAFAEIWVDPIPPEVQNDSLAPLATYGPIKVKPLMIFSFVSGPVYGPWFTVGQEIWFGTHWEIKGTGSYKGRLEIRNSKGALIGVFKFGAFGADNPTFQPFSISINSLGACGETGYYTGKIVLVDVATGNTWSQQTRIHVSAPD